MAEPQGMRYLSIPMGQEEWTGEDMLMCLRCGSLCFDNVRSQYVHDKWHEQIRSVQHFMDELERQRRKRQMQGGQQAG